MKLMVLMTLLAAVCLAVFPAAALHRGKVEILSVQNILDFSEKEEADISREPLNLPEIPVPFLPETEKMQEQCWKPFRILDRATGKIEEVPVKEYVTGALCSEMPAVFQMEALKAQAVSAHTWALYCQQEAVQKGREYDFSADPSHWQGYVTEEQAKKRFGDKFEEYWERICRAADAVWTKILLTPDGSPVAAAYHAISCGKTEDAENVWGYAVPCLTSVESKGDIHAPGYQKNMEYALGELRERLESEIPGIYLSDEPEQWIKILEQSPSGYVTLAQAGDQQISGGNLRQILGLRSSYFDYAVQQGKAVFTVRGYGHGVGLSQYGADYLARQGQTYDAILTHYYQGAVVSDRK